jgi:hypothetical protein
VEDLKNGEDDKGVVKYDNTSYLLTARGKSTKQGLEGDDGSLHTFTLPGTNKAKMYVNFGGVGYEIIDRDDKKSLLARLGL